ncbi:MAG: phosphoesterase, partial [Acidobacteriaceae bacterium]
MNSLPMTAAWSPDHRYLALVNAGYGTAESDYEQSVAVLDTTTGKLTDYPIPLTDMTLPQTLYSGIAFSGDGSRIYLSFDSISEPNGKAPEEKAPQGGRPRVAKPDGTGNAVGVYRLTDEGLVAERMIPVPLRDLEAGQTQHHGAMDLPVNEAIPAPAGLAVVKGATEKLLVADEYSDDVL